MRIGNHGVFCVSMEFIFKQKCLVMKMQNFFNFLLTNGPEPKKISFCASFFRYYALHFPLSITFNSTETVANAFV